MSAASPADLILAEDIRRKMISDLALDEENDCDWRAILDLLDDLPGSISAAEFLHAGLTTGGEVVSLASAMILFGNMNALKHLILDNKLGLVVDDFCRWRRASDSLPEYSSLAHTAVNKTSHNSLRMAFRLTPYDAKTDVKTGERGSCTLAELHFEALNRAVNSSSYDQGSYNCAYVLQEHGVPLTSASYTKNPVATALLGETWYESLAVGLAAMLRKYYEAGHFDLNAPLDGSTLGDLGVGGLTPLEAAIKLNNPLAAKELLALGCDYRASLENDQKDLAPLNATIASKTGPAASATPPEATVHDLIDLVRSYSVSNEDEMIACVVAGLMESEIAARTADAAAPAATTPAAPSSRRAHRASL